MEILLKNYYFFNICKVFQHGLNPNYSIFGSRRLDGRVITLVVTCWHVTQEDPGSSPERFSRILGPTR